MTKLKRQCLTTAATIATIGWGVPAGAQNVGQGSSTAAGPQSSETQPSATPLPVAGSDPAPAQQAETGVSDIVVTAQKREQRLQDVPVAVSALTSQALVANRIANVRDLDAITPGLTVRTVSGGSSLPTYSIRGLVSQGNTVGADKGVALYVDGVYISSALGSIFNLADIERIEVLRGPQGTLFGRNSTGGAISITTREPDGKFHAKQGFTYGNYDQFRSATSISTPQVGPFSAIVNYTHSQRRGDIRNLGAGTRWDFTRALNRPKVYTSPKYLGDSDIDAVFAAVRADISDRFVATYRYDYVQEDSTAAGTGVSYAQPAVRAVIAAQPNQAILTPITDKRPKAVNNAGVVPGKNENYGHALTATYRVSDAVSLKNIASYRYNRVEVPFQDISGLGGIVNTGGAFLNAVLGTAVANATRGAPLLWQAVGTFQTNRQWSDELQLNVDTDPVTLTAGALYFRQKTRFATGETEDGLGANRNGSFVVYPGYLVPSTAQPRFSDGQFSNVQQRSTAVYGQAEVHVLPTVDIIGGIRYTWDKKTGIDRTIVSAVNPTTFPIFYKDSRPTYSIGANYKPNRDILLYAKYSTGYISGGSLSTLVFDPETAKSYEAGIKADWFDRLLRTNLALYSVKYGNLQLTTATSGIPSLDALRAQGVTQALINVGDARSRGFELETTLAPARGLQFTGNVGFLDFKFRNLLPAATVGLERFLPLYRPKWTVSLAAQYTSEPLFDDVRVTGRVDGAWKSRTFTSQTFPVQSAGFNAAEQAAYLDALTVQPYWLVNSRVALDGFEIGGSKASVALWARNLFDNRSISYGPSLVTLIGAIFEPARTYGVDLTVSF